MSNGTPPPGTYQQTSQNITFTPTGQGRYLLSADCQTINGQWVPSQLAYDIANCNGQLTWAPTGCP